MANLWLFIFISCILLRGTDSEREGVICYNSTLEDYRLKGSVVKRSFVQSEMIDCLMECATAPCCRSINYKKHLKDNETNCEMLHSVVDETESQAVLEKNASYDYIYLANTAKTFNESCVQDTDKCSLGAHKCHSNAICINTIGSYKCHCRSGFSGNGETCSDVDECAQENPKCHSKATCNNIIGSYECQCRSGFAGNGKTCSDTDECSLGTHKCHSNATCINTIGSYGCHCRSGFTGNGPTCSDVDECLGTHKCHSNATCNNTIGSYECHCRRGFAGNEATCSDIDECSLGTYKCHLNATCNNTIGSYECHCRRGFAKNGTTCSVHEFDSDILLGESPEFTKLLGEWLPQTGSWSVCWRATNMSKKECEKFHEGCDGKVPTLTVVKVVKNHTALVFGGFATSKWAKTTGSSSAPGSFLFSFRNNDDLPPFKSPLNNADDGNAILLNPESAVKFGTGPDLAIADSIISQHSYQCYASIGFTYQSPPGYSFRESKTQSLLAGSMIFTPAKVEVLYLN